MPQQIAGGDIYPALEKGTIDAAEWVGPYDDEKLGFYKIAPHYYYPGWWEGGSMLHGLRSISTNGMRCRRIIRLCSSRPVRMPTNWMMAKYDELNPAALKRLLANGVKLHAFSPEIMEACSRRPRNCMPRSPRRTQSFKKVYDSMTAFSNNTYQWFQVAELGYDSFMVRHSHA